MEYKSHLKDGTIFATNLETNILQVAWQGDDSVVADLLFVVSSSVCGGGA